MNARFLGCLLAAMAGLAVPSAMAQESKSAPLAKQLAAMLDEAKLDSVAAKDPAAPNVFFSAMYIPNSQLLVLSGTYAEPILLEMRIYKREYRDTYADLNGASPFDTRLMVEDMGADGLAYKRVPNRPFDTVERGGKRTKFDSAWKQQKLKEEEYAKTFAETDERYAQMLMALIAEAKRPK